jgi:hypothetical protein
VLTLLPVDQVELDRTNPRIRRFLEIHEGEPTYEQVALALDVSGGGGDAQGSTTPDADSDEGGHLFQCDRGHRSNLMAAT